MSQSYQALAASSIHVFEEKRSVFTAVLSPVTCREQAMAQLGTLRADYPGASHYCWAYILGNTEQPQSQAFSDDGEPAGTAGKPILHVLSHRHAGDCLAVVVRVFGGIKLGAGGLVRAYGASVSQALNQAHWKTITATQPMTVKVSFAFEERIRHLLSTYRIEVESVDYATDVRLQIHVPLSLVQDLTGEVQQLTSGQGLLFSVN